MNVDCAVKASASADASSILANAISHPIAATPDPSWRHVLQRDQALQLQVEYVQVHHPPFQ